MAHFEFEKLVVYKKSLEYYSQVVSISLNRMPEGGIVARQLGRAALSITLNISEGCGRKGTKDKKRFYVISRGSLYETVSILQVLRTQGILEEADYRHKYNLATEIARMLYTMIANLEKDTLN